MRVLFLVLLLCAWAPAEPAPSGLSRALGAAFQEFLAQPGAYARLHRSYTGQEPKFSPKAVTVAWPVRQDGSPLDTALKTGTLRLGFCENPPYHVQGKGLDRELGDELARRIGAHFGVPNLKVVWVEERVNLQDGQEQQGMYAALIGGLKQGRYQAAFSGLLILPEQPVASSSPTSVLFTDVFYTGREALKGLRNESREAFVKDLARRPGEFTFLSTVNPGPSSRPADALAAEVRQAGGKAVSLHGNIAELIESLRHQGHHFVVGDSVSLGYFAHQPGFAGTDLNLALSDQPLDLGPFTLPGGFQQSELSQALSAAFRQYCEGGGYSDLYQKYLGVPQVAPQPTNPVAWPPITPGSSLDRVVRSGKLRLGFWRHEPYYFTKDGQDAGFELELGNAMGKILAEHYPGLQWTWVEQKFVSDGRGQENLLLYDSLEPALLSGHFDVAFSGLLRMPDRPVGVADPDIFFFCNVVYTGKDGLDLKGVGNRDQFVQFLLQHPDCSLISTPGGPSQETAERLVADVKARGGRATSVLGTVPQLIEAASRQTAHFMVGDAIALSALTQQPGFKGLNLNIPVRDVTDLMAPMTGLDP